MADGLRLWSSRPHESVRAAFFWVTVWSSLALSFNIMLWVYWRITATPDIANTQALNFFTGYLIEQSLSIDNLFVFYTIFSQFKLPAAAQQRVLTYGIWGAVIMRLGLILAGTWLVSRFHWVLYVMGAFLLVTGVKLLFMKEKEKDFVETALYRVITSLLRVTKEQHGQSFFVRRDRVLYATPLFVVLIFVEFSDLVFALDSIPAIFAITRDPFIVWSSNVFAILGLRSMYFVLAAMADRFRLLRYGVALILVFVGGKMVVEPWISLSVQVSLCVIITILSVFTVLSLREQRV